MELYKSDFQNFSTTCWDFSTTCWDFKRSQIEYNHWLRVTQRSETAAPQRSETAAPQRSKTAIATVILRSRRDSCMRRVANGEGQYAERRRTRRQAARVTRARTARARRKGTSEVGGDATEDKEQDAAGGGAHGGTACTRSVARHRATRTRFDRSRTSGFRELCMTHKCNGCCQMLGLTRSEGAEAGASERATPDELQLRRVPSR
jgi:hypothetical protein